MKTFYLFISLTLLVTFNQLSNAQVPRQFVLLEQSANTSMPTCSYFISITNDIETAIPNTAVQIYHDMDWFYTEEGALRLEEMYGEGDNEYPAFWVDGTRIPYMTAIGELQSIIDERKDVQSNFSIDLSETHSSNNYSATIVLTKEAEFSNTNMVLRLVIKEKDIYYSWIGWEGETVETVDNVVRAMIPDRNGTDVLLSGSIDTQTINLNFTLDPTWDRDNCELVAYIQDVDTKEVLQALSLPLLEIDYNYDAYLFETLAPAASVCDNTISPVVILKNKGGENLLSLDFEYSVDGETPSTYNWTGNLAFNERKEITLSAYTFTQDYNTQKTLIITCSNPNGETDENPSNDEISTLFTQTSYASTQLFLELKTDDFGEDTSWELINSTGTIIASGDGYANATTYYETIEIASSDCYTFTVYDAYGDGIQPPGYYILMDEDDNIIAENPPIFNDEVSTEFNVTTTVDITEFSNPSISVFPNPNDGVFYISKTEGCKISVFDILGNRVYYNPSGSDQKICVEGLGNGNYTVQITDSKGLSFFSKVIILK